MMSTTCLACSGPGLDDVEGSHPMSSTRLSIASVTCSLAFERDHVTGILDGDQTCAGDAIGQPAAVLERGQLVVACRR